MYSLSCLDNSLVGVLLALAYGGGYKKKKPPVTVEKATKDATQDQNIKPTQFPGEAARDKPSPPSPSPLVNPSRRPNPNAKANPSPNAYTNPNPNYNQRVGDSKRTTHDNPSKPAGNILNPGGKGVEVDKNTPLKKDQERANEKDMEEMKQSAESPITERERELYQAVVELKAALEVSSTHRSALKELEDKAEEDPSAAASTAAGLLNTPFRVTLDLPKAFLYYKKAIQHPFLEIGRAHYMIGFLTMHHPEAVTEEYLLQFAPRSPSGTDSSSSEKNLESEPQSGKETDTKSEPAPKETPARETEEHKGELAVNNVNKTLSKPNVPLAHLHFALAAKAGNMEGRVSLAMRHLRGQFTPRSCRHAAAYLRPVAERLAEPYRDNPRPSVKLASDSVRLESEFADGKSIADEERDHIQYFQFAAERGQSVDAQIAMSLLHLYGLGEVPQDYNRAFHYMKQAAKAAIDKNGDLVVPADADGSALAHLGYFYKKGIGVEPDEDVAVELWLKAAQKGSANAQMRLGLCYLHGDCGLPRNPREAKKYFLEAVSQEESEALYQLAVMYDSPKFGMPHAGNARLHFQRAAQSGHIPALYELALMNLDGVSVPMSCDTAIGLMRKILDLTTLKNRTIEAYKEYSRGRHARALIRYEIAADMGSLLGQRNAAFLYEHRVGVSDLGLNMTEYQIQNHALYWYREAGQQDSASANLKLGDYHYYGWGTDVDLEKSASYYQIATQLRNAQAAFNLGYMHQYGLGLPQDYHLAKRYYDMAVEHNPSEARFPSLFALLWMNVEQTLTRTFAIDGANADKFAVLGLEWDTALLIALSSILIVALVIRAFLR